MAADELHAGRGARVEKSDRMRPVVGRTIRKAESITLRAAAAPGFKFTDKPEVVARFRESILRVAELPCDIVISTHPSATNLDGKLKQRATRQPTDPDPFVDRGCKALAANALKALEARIAEEKK